MRCLRVPLMVCDHDFRPALNLARGALVRAVQKDEAEGGPGTPLRPGLFCRDGSICYRIRQPQLLCLLSKCSVRVGIGLMCGSGELMRETPALLRGFFWRARATFARPRRSRTAMGITGMAQAEPRAVGL